MFDLDDPANDHKMFEIRVELPYITTGGIGLTAGESMTVSAKVVFRNGRAAIGQ